MMEASAVEVVLQDPFSEALGFLAVSAAALPLVPLLYLHLGFLLHRLAVVRLLLVEFLEQVEVAEVLKLEVQVRQALAGLALFLGLFLHVLFLVA